MRYISGPSMFSYLNPSQKRLLRFSSHRVCRLNGGWLVVSPSTKGWCELTDQEYATYRAMADQSAITTLDEVGTDEKLEFLAALVQCGLIEPEFENPDTISQRLTNSRPFFLTLILSGNCNLSCRYCYLGLDSTRPIHPNVKAAREAIQCAFDRPNDHIVIDFGEIASAYPLFQELVSFARDLQREKPTKAVTLRVQTNGINLKPPVLDYLEQHGIFVGLSLDGPRQLHDQMRVSASGQGSHRQAEAGLREIVQRGMPHIVLCTVSSANVNYPADIVEYFIQLGISHFAFKPVIKRGTAAVAWQEIGVTATEYKEFLSGIVNYAIKRRTWKALDIHLIQHLFRLMRDPRGWVDRCPGDHCGAGTNLLVLNPYGAFYPCPRLASLKQSSLYLGNSLPDAIRAGASLASSALTDRCVTCIWSAYCEGRCRLSEHLEEGIQSTEDFTCDVHQHVYELLIRKLIPAADLISAVSGSGPGRFEVIQREFFKSCLAGKNPVSC